MKKIIVYSILFLFSVMNVSAVDLTDFPDIFRGQPLYLLAGADGSAEDVVILSQLQIMIYNDFEGKIVTKSLLDNELNNPLENNLIVVGNPCENKVMHEILSSEDDCEDFVKPGEAYLQIFERNNKVYLLLVAYSDSGTRKLADLLLNYKATPLRGDFMRIIVDNDANVEDFEEEEIDEEEEDVDEDDIRDEQEEEEETVDVDEEELDEEEFDDDPIIEEEVQQTESGEGKAVPRFDTEDNFIAKFLKWLFSLFG